MDAILFHPETSMRRALVLALGTYGTDGLYLPASVSLSVGKLLDLYRNDPDTGIHGAAEWALRQWKNEEKLKEIDAELSKLKDRGDRRWFVNSQGQTFTVIDGPVEFLMGSPSTEPDRDRGEIPHRMVIPRRFAIATKEVSKEQWQAFVKQNPEWAIDQRQRHNISPDPHGTDDRVLLVSSPPLTATGSASRRVAQGPVVLPSRQSGEYDDGDDDPRRSFSRRKGYRLPDRGGVGIRLPVGYDDEPLLWSLRSICSMGMLGIR